MWSDPLDEILKYFKLATKEKDRAEKALDKCNNELQDLYHQLEFGENSYHEKARMANKIQDIRKERRLAKYQIEQTTPIDDWVSRNFNTIRSLEKLLAEVKNAEEHTDPQKLFYSYKTDVVEETLGSQEKKLKEPT